MSVYTINPLEDRRWGCFLENHPQASVFHSTGWLDALRRTYDYEVVVLTTSPPGADLSDGVPFCKVGTWLGKRLVSLPFSDHCEPLVSRREDLDEILEFAKGALAARRLKYLELRPRDVRLPGGGPGRELGSSNTYCLHRLDLTPGASAVFGGFHRSCVQRAIRRAEREGLTYEAGASASLVATFHRLLRLTRRRHGVPPQPLAWFQNLAGCLGDHLTIRVASKDGRPIAGILTLTFRETIVYKYGGSDADYHRLGGMPYLFWRTIQEATQQGVKELDLGRSDWGQQGLLDFKDHLGAARSTLTYYRHPEALSASDRWKIQAARGFVARLPEPVLSVAGRLFYRYLG